MTTLADAEAPAAASPSEFGTTFFVEAAAGTGKTTALVRRIVGIVSAGVATLDRIVAVTFTEKAAGETKLHLRSEIEAARADAGPEQRARLDRALEQLELARIGTIHAFCGDLLHERPVEAGTIRCSRLRPRTKRRRWPTKLSTAGSDVLADPPEGIRRLLRRPVGESCAARTAARGHEQPARASGFSGPWRRDLSTATIGIDALIAELAALGSLAAESSWPEDPQARNLVEIEASSWMQPGSSLVSGRDYDGLETELRGLPACPAGATVARGRPTFRGSHT